MRELFLCFSQIMRVKSEAIAPKAKGSVRLDRWQAQNKRIKTRGKFSY